jgi:hypothetical protein
VHYFLPKMKKLVGGGNMALSSILTEARPFGPPDQARIDQIEDAIALLDVGEPITSALAETHTLIYGRKGCGKSSVISIFEGYRHIRPTLARLNLDFGVEESKYISVKIDSWRKFLDIQTIVMNMTAQKFGKNSHSLEELDLIPPEIIEEAWIEQIWEQIFQRVRDIAYDSNGLVDLIPNVLLCFDDEAMAAKRGTFEYIASQIFGAAKADVMELLHTHGYEIFVLFDSMERYPISNPVHATSMSGFLRAINTISTKHDGLKVVFALPEELLPHIRGASSNILKDFSSSYRMVWKNNSLLRILAYRYRLFLKSNESTTDYYRTSIQKLDITSTAGLRRFYSLLLPDFVQNGVADRTEPTISYIMRHTHLLPRHLIVLFNKMSTMSYKKTGSWERITSESVIAGIGQAENDIAEEILQPYDVIYNKIGRVLSGSLGSLAPFFTYGGLDRVLTRIPIPAAWNLTKPELFSLLWQIGIIGRVCKDEELSDIYVLAEFSFVHSGNIAWDGEDELCFHPVFSRYFNAYRHRNGDKRIVYPKGVSFNI